MSETRPRWLIALALEVPRGVYREIEDRLREEVAAAEERGRRAEHDRAQGVIHVLHQCIRGKCACADNGVYSQFACEQTARTVIDSWDLAPRDSAPQALVVCDHCPEFPHPLNDDGTTCVHPRAPPDSVAQRKENSK